VRTSAEEPDQIRRSPVARFQGSGKAPFRPMHQTRPMSDLQRKIDTRGVKQPLPENAHGRELNSQTRAATLLGYDFSQIPVHTNVPVNIQRKLSVNGPGGMHEQEADRVADQVTRITDSQIQRAYTHGREYPKLHVERTDQDHQLLHTRRVKPNGAENSVVPPAAQEVLRSPGIPLDSATRAFFEPRFGHDFSRVRVHTDQRAGEAAKELDARAFTHGTDIAFGPGQYVPNTAQGRHLIAHELTHVVQQAGQNVVGEVQRAPQPEPAVANEEVAELQAEVPAERMNNEELVDGIFDDQLAILEGWDNALHNFDKVLTSASDKSAKPNFKKVVQEFFWDKVTSEIISKSKVPGAGDAFKLLGDLEKEVQRAAAAEESATLRKFIVDHRNAVTTVKQTVYRLRNDFKANVRLTGEGGGNEAAVMREHLVDLLSRLDSRLKESTSQKLFIELSEEWIRQSTTPETATTRSPAFIVIRIEGDPPHFSVRDAEIKGPSGQQIAEQLLRDSPAGVDVFDMRVPRRILYFERGKSFHKAIVRLDEDNNLVNEGSFIEGNYGPIYRALMSTGLPPTKKLSGD
jgi:hypothetical protein